MERDAIDFGSLKVSVLFRRLFIPTLCGMLSISAVTVADGIFVGQGVGSDGIAAVNIYVPLLMVFQGMVVVYSGTGFPDVDGRRTFRYPFGRGAEAGDVVQCYLGVAQRVAGLVVYFPAGEGRHGGCVRYRDQCIRRRRYRFVVPAVPGPFVVPLSA